MADYELVVNYDKCTGCRLCETVCSMCHEPKSEVNPQKSRIRIVKLEGEADVTSIPVKCAQCEKAPCEAICPIGAISTDLTTGARHVDKEKCIGCSACVYVCLFGTAVLDRSLKKFVICDLCDGDPKCVRFCPWDALQYIRSDDVSIKLKRARADKLLEFLKVSSVPPE